MKNHKSVLLLGLFLFQSLIADDDIADIALDVDMSSLQADTTSSSGTSNIMSTVLANTNIASDSVAVETENESATTSSETIVMGDSEVNVNPSATEVIVEETAIIPAVAAAEDLSIARTVSVETPNESAALVTNNTASSNVTIASSSASDISTTSSAEPLVSNFVETSTPVTSTSTLDIPASNIELAIPSAPAETIISDTAINNNQVSSSVATSTVSSSNVTSLPTEDDVTLTVDESEELDISNTMTTTGVGGNWLQKRVYYQKASDLYEEIQAQVALAEDTRLNFLTEIHSLHTLIDDFYQTVSFNQGQIKTLLDSYTTALSNEALRDGDLTQDELAMQQTIIAEQAQVTEIGETISIVSELDEKIDEVMQLVFTTIDTCRSYQSQSWNNFKDITQSLDDQKARTLYYEMENHSDNIAQQITYLNSTLFSFLKTTLGGQIKTNINSIESALESLQVKGVNLGLEINNFFKQDIETQSERKQLEINEATDQAVEDYKKVADNEAVRRNAAKEKERQAKLENSISCKIITFIKNGWCGIISRLGFLEKPFEAVSSAAAALGETLKPAVCFIRCLLSKMKFW
jgi:hypothetical protein